MIRLKTMACRSFPPGELETIPGKHHHRTIHLLELHAMKKDESDLIRLHQLSLMKTRKSLTLGIAVIIIIIIIIIIICPPPRMGPEIPWQTVLGEILEPCRLQDLW
jgi:hypothetical protein